MESREDLLSGTASVSCPGHGNPRSPLGLQAAKLAAECDLRLELAHGVNTIGRSGHFLDARHSDEKTYTGIELLITDRADKYHDQLILFHLS